MRSIALHFVKLFLVVVKSLFLFSLSLKHGTRPSIPCNMARLLLWLEKRLVWYVTNSVLYVNLPYVVMLLVAYSLRFNIFYYSACGLVRRFC